MKSKSNKLFDIEHLERLAKQPVLTMAMLRRGLTEQEIRTLQDEDMIWVNVINGQVEIVRR